MSNVDEILKLKELLDKEIITQEEFEKKKNELLTNEKIVNNTTNVTSNTKENNNGYSKGCLIAILTILFPLFMFWAIGSIFSEPTYVKNVKLQNNKNIIESYSMSYVYFSNIVESCGFSDYTLERDELLDDLDGEGTIDFRIKSGNANGIVYVKDSVIQSVRYADNYLYKDGIVHHTLSEYIVTQDERRNLILNTQNVINIILKSPSTAKYPLFDEWKVGKIDGSTIVQGYVDSQNSFGATIRSEFQVTYKNDTVTSIIFDGEEYIK